MRKLTPEQERQVNRKVAGDVFKLLLWLGALFLALMAGIGLLAWLSSSLG